MTRQICPSSPIGLTMTGSNSPVNSSARDSVPMCVSVSISNRASKPIRILPVLDSTANVSCFSSGSGVLGEIRICCSSISKQTLARHFGFENDEIRLCRMQNGFFPHNCTHLRTLWNNFFILRIFSVYQSRRQRSARIRKENLVLNT